jgi:hypothetical protein
MVKWLLLATVEDRAGMASVCLASIREHLPDWRVLVVAQGYDTAQQVEHFSGLTVLSSSVSVGMHTAKYAGLKWIAQGHAYDNWTVCSIDDDMEFLGRTNLEPAVTKALEPGVGLVSAGWVNHPSRVDAHRTPEEFVHQPIVYTGGGLVFDGRTARLLLDHLPARASFRSDNVEWSLATYLAGLANYRYRGSVAVHRVCRTGGRKAWVESTDTQPSDPKWITLQPGRIGTSADVTPAAKRTHLENRAQHYGGTHG